MGSGHWCLNQQIKYQQLKKAVISHQATSIDLWIFTHDNNLSVEVMS